MFFTRSDFAGVASIRVHRPAKHFETAFDRLQESKAKDVQTVRDRGPEHWCPSN